MRDPSIGLVPILVSDLTCEAVLGVPWRSLRRMLAERGIRIRRIGRRPVVRVDLVLSLLDGEATAAPRLTDADVVRLAVGGRR